MCASIDPEVWDERDEELDEMIDQAIRDMNIGKEDELIVVEPVPEQVPMTEPVPERVPDKVPA